MRYVFGVTCSAGRRYVFNDIISDDNTQLIEGIYGYSIATGLPLVVSDRLYNGNQPLDNFKIPIATTLDSAERYLRYLTDAYRDEFDTVAKKYDLDRSKLKFYLLKVDSSKFKNLKFTELNGTYIPEHLNKKDLKFCAISQR